MKKLLVFGYTMEMGGAEKALVDTLKYLKDLCEIDLYLLEKKGSLLADIPNNINVYQMKNNLFSYLLFRFIPIYRKYKINKIYNKKKYDYVFGYMEGRSATWVTDIKDNHPKKYAWIHNDVYKFNIGISEKEIKNSYNKLTKVICVSKEAKDNFCKKYNIDKSKVSVIYNYINEEEILNKAKEFKVTNKEFTFVNVAKMREQKRQDRIIKAAIYLKELGYKFKIQLIGDGPNLDKITEMVYNNNLDDMVEVLGLKTNPYPYILNANCFVLSSMMEGYGIVIKEALLLHKRIITTDVVGPREILEDGKYGIIVKNNDDDLKYAMEDMLKNKDKYTYLDKELKHYKGDNEEIKKETLKLLDL